MKPSAMIDFPSLIIRCLLILLYLPLPLHASGEREPATSDIEAALTQLASLYTDRYATEFAGARQICTVPVSEKDNYHEETYEMTLALFTLEGSGGGNNHTQYLAVLHGTRLMGSKPIGGKGWRWVSFGSCDSIRPIQNPDTNSLRFPLQAIANTVDDPPNFPSRKGIVMVEVSSTRGVTVFPMVAGLKSVQTD